MYICIICDIIRIWIKFIFIYVFKYLNVYIHLYFYNMVGETYTGTCEKILFLLCASVLQSVQWISYISFNWIQTIVLRTYDQSCGRGWISNKYSITCIKNNRKKTNVLEIFCSSGDAPAGLKIIIVIDNKKNIMKIVFRVSIALLGCCNVL